MTIVALTQRAGGVQAYEMIVPGRTGLLSPDPRTHEGYEWLYILDGRLRLVLGPQELVLLPGRQRRGHVMSNLQPLTPVTADA